MLDKIKQTVKHTSIFAFGKISGKLVGFVLLPVYTKEISVSDYGVLGLLEVIDLLGGHVLSLGLPIALMRWHTFADSEIQKRNLAFTTFFSLLSICFISLFLVLPVKETISEFLLGTTIYGNLFIYVFLSMSFTTLAKIPQTIMRIEEKSFLYSISVIGQFVLSLFLNIYFVAFQKRGVEGVLVAHVISSGALFLTLLPYLIKRMNFALEFQRLKEMITFGYPFILSAISATILNLGDRYLLTIFSSLSEVGLYSLGYKFSNVLKILVVDSFALGLPIVGWQIIRHNSQPKRFFSKTLTYLVFVLLWLGLFLISYSKGIIHLLALNESYWEAYLVIPYLVIGIVFGGMQQVYFFELQIPKKTHIISVIISTSAVLNIVLNLILIPYYGMMGAAYATVLSQFGGLLFAYNQVQRYYPMQYEIKRIIMLFLVASGLCVASFIFDDYSLPGRLLFKGALILSFPFVLLLVRFYEPVELDRIRYFLGKLTRRSK